MIEIKYRTYEKLTLIVSLTLLLCTQTVASGVQIISSDNRGVVIEYQPELAEPVFQRDNVINISLKNGDNIFVPGVPEIPVYFLYVAVPPTSNPTVKLMRRTAGAQYNGKMNVFEPREGNPAEYKSDYLLSLDEVVGQFEMRSLNGLKVLRIPIYPVRISNNPATVELAEQIELYVDFGNYKLSLDKRPVKLSRLTKKLVVNAGQAVEWGRYLTSNFSPESWLRGYIYRFSVDKEGIYSLTYDDLVKKGAELSNGGVNSTNLKIFGNGGGELPLDPGDEAPLGLSECAIHVDDGGDGRFEAGDRIIFYGRGAGGWLPDTERGWSYKINHYTNVNYYWLNIDPEGGGRRMDSFQLDALPDIETSAGLSRYYIEPERFIFYPGGFTGTGRDWYGYTFDGSSQTSYSVNLENPDASIEARLRVRIVNPLRTNSYPRIRISLNGELIDEFSPTGTSDLNGYSVPQDIASMLRHGNNTIALEQYRADAQALFDWLELSYHTTLDRYRIFEEISYSGNVRYNITGLDDPWIFNVSDHNSVRFERAAFFTVDQNSARPQRYILASVEDFNEVNSPFKSYFPPVSDIEQLWSVNNSANVILITPDDYWETVEPLIGNYARRDRHRPLIAKRVRLSEIYNRFSGGLQDPAAIRNMLMYAKDYWTGPPQFVLFCGDGDYNYRDIDRPKSENFLPPYENGALCSDDWFIDFTPYSGSSGTIPMPDPELASGRLTALNKRELEAMVDKNIKYTEDPEYGPWRSRVTLVADDEFGANWNTETEHIRNTEILSDQYIPSYFETDKIYLTEYERTWGRQKPRSGDDLVESINQGTLLVNYMGHGNPTLWAHEHVFVLSRDLPRIERSRRLPLYLAFTCDWAYWDDPGSQSFSEQLLAMPEGGAIGIIASTRLTGGGSNFNLAKKFFECLFDDPNETTLGEALTTAKNYYRASTNNASYHLLGDPVMNIGVPQLSGEIDSLPQPLVPLDISTVYGHIQRSNGRIDSSYSGHLEFLVNDTRIRRHYQHLDISLEYYLNGPVVYRGLFSVSDGSFNGQFVVPRDVTLGDSLGRVTAYFYNDEIDGVIARDYIKFADEIADRLDNASPSIDIYVGSRVFRTGDLIGPEPLLIVELSDSSGLNLTSAMGHGINLLIDGNRPLDLTSYFLYYEDSYQSGSLEKRIGPLEPGLHNIEIQAWDSFNNLAVKDIDVEVTTSPGGFKVERVLNYPNPFREKTELTFRVTGQISEYEIKIFTVGGRMIRDYRGVVIDNSDYIRNIFWNGRDSEGRIVGNGVYLYKVVARNGAGHHAEGLGRIALIR